MTARICRRAAGIAGIAFTAAMLTGCSSAPDLVGMWESTGDSGTVFFYDDGSCAGMMTVDIGGPMYCTVSDDDEGGRYTLMVRQSMNTATYLLEPDGEDTITVLDTTGYPLFQLNRI